jgi:nucleoside-diphosphate-sugar epimerase
VVPKIAMRLALWGAGGFVGRAIAEAAGAAGVEVIRLPRIELSKIPDLGQDLGRIVRGWLSTHPVEADELLELLIGAECVVNAAGLARPEGSDWSSLLRSNAILPGVIAALAARAQVPRLIQISSASVQGRKDPLDETTVVQPFSPYSYSKAAGEALLSGKGIELPRQVVIYRPTSVQGSDREITKALVRLAGKPILPLSGSGNVPLPVCLIENVAAGVLEVALMAQLPPRIVLQPWEHMTTRRLLEAFGTGARMIEIPTRAVRVAHGLGKTLASRSPRLDPYLRRFELLAFGQRISATALEQAGFRPRNGFEGYRRLAERVRQADLTWSTDT